MAAACLALVFLGLWFGRSGTRADPVSPIVVDGSNVMHWGTGAANFTSLRLVLDDLIARGLTPIVYFDANVGYKLLDTHIDAPDLARLLSLPRSQVTIVASGTPADPVLIERAIALRAQVVSNDRFMDWRAAYPVLRGKGFLVKGRLRGETVELRGVRVAV